MNPFKAHIPASLVIMGILLCMSIATNAQDDITTVEDSAFANRMHPAVPFDHDGHNEKAGIVECNACHHIFENGEKLADTDSVGMECSSCHLEDAGAAEMDLIRVYHLQCRTCHLREKSGPIFCGECHSGNP